MNGDKTKASSFEAIDPWYKAAATGGDATYGLEHLSDALLFRVKNPRGRKTRQKIPKGVARTHVTRLAVPKPGVAAVDPRPRPEA